MKRGSTSADTCRMNGWTVGTYLIGDPGQLEVAPVVRITAIGETEILAVQTNRKAGDDPRAARECMWTLDLRRWRALDGAG